MKKPLSIILTIVLFVVLLGSAYYAYTRYADSRKLVPPTEPSFTPPISAQTTDDSPAASGTQAPAKTSSLPKAIDFTLKTLDGRTVTLSDYAGKKAVVINFWATWCPPCRSELPDFNEQAEALGEDEVIFLMVDLTDGSRETPEIVKKFIADNKYTFKNVLLDTTLSTADAYAVRGIPSTFFINKDGSIVDQYEGAINAQTLKEGIDKALQ